MIITLAGKLGSGKSTIAKMLVEKTGFQRISVGDFMSELAKKRGITLIELNKESDIDGGKIDEILDAKQKELKYSKEDLILDSRLGWFFVPSSFKIYLDVSLEESAKRIFNEKRPDELENTTFEQTKANIILRKGIENRRYRKHYNIENCDDPSNYDLVINTTNMTPKEIVDKIIKSLSTINNKIQSNLS